MFDSAASDECAFAAMRRAMVDSQLRTSDVTDPAVVAAMRVVPREDFVPADRRAQAYADRVIPLGDGRSMNAPLATGRMLVAADLTRADRALIVGDATGYVAALAERLAGSVITADSAEGASDAAPFDVILIDGAVETLPATLTDQLRDGGRIVCGLVDGAVTRLAHGVKRGGSVRPVAFADVSCVPLPQFSQPHQFAF